MTVFGVVAEFNPFHNGHAALLRHGREAGATHIVCVMSGNFVQRGEAAVTDKGYRAKAALLCGADLVLELPLPFATATAQQFARGAISILKSTGCVDALCFGSESGDVEALRLLAESVDDSRVSAALGDYLEGGATFAKARQLAVEAVYGGEVAQHLATPNNALAVEYLRQAAHLGWPVKAVTMPRQGIAHDGAAPAGRFASASYLRGRELSEFETFVPPAAFGVYQQGAEEGGYPADPAKLETAILSHLRRMDAEAFAQLPDLSEGLERKLYKSVRQTASLEELYQAVKSKRYTLARVRRLVLSAFLGITRADTAALPPYLRVLGMNGRGRELLGRMKSTCALPVSASLSRLEEQGGHCARLAALEARAWDLYSLCLPNPLPCGGDYTRKAVVVGNEEFRL